MCLLPSSIMCLAWSRHDPAVRARRAEDCYLTPSTTLIASSRPAVGNVVTGHCIGVTDASYIGFRNIDSGAVKVLPLSSLLTI